MDERMKKAAKWPAAMAAVISKAQHDARQALAMSDSTQIRARTSD